MFNPSLKVLILTLFMIAAVEPSFAESEVMGLPFSNQWIYDRTSSFLYFSYNTSQMNHGEMKIDHYLSNFGDASLTSPAIDFFTHLFSFAAPDSLTPAKNFSIWGRYSIGLAGRQGRLSDTQSSIDGTLEKASLLVFSAKIGTLLSYDRWDRIKPYAGLEIFPYYYRHSADLSGAEKQGGALCYGPVLGAHFPIFFGGRGTLLAEVRSIIPVDGTSQILERSTDYSLGMGLAF